MDKTKQTNPNLPVLCAAQVQSAMMSPVQQQIAQATRSRPGQPTKRTPELIDVILDQIADGRSLLSVCQADEMPGYSTFNRWCREDPELLAAVDMAYEFHARTLDDIADDILSGGVGSTGNLMRDKERVAHLRWRLGKLNRRFRDKVQMDVVQHQPVILDMSTIMGEGGDGV
ncbi:hypothetical protein QP179_03310 [Sphingomonas aurantiaca]|uniref:terminase small subunit-like protein n=1 Tax=Sphingomonas aurantiaca TaxID=185949 RepID=UPI002FE00605